jgi:hypothetical protein
MSKIFKFGEFIKLNEKNDEEIEEKSIEIKPRFSLVILKKFFKELKDNVYYWFNYDVLSKYYDLENLEEEKRSLSVWFKDKVKDRLDVPQFMYKIKFMETEIEGDIEKVETVLLNIHIYDFETNDLLKEEEIKIDLSNINASFINKRLKIIKKRILKAPKSKEDIEDFKMKQTRRLGDNIY